MADISESDWRIVRELKPVALERLCERILSAIRATCDRSSDSFHARFLRLFSDLEAGNSDVGQIFDDLKRSNAIQRIGIMRAHRIITDAEFARFSQHTREAATRIADARVKEVKTR